MNFFRNLIVLTFATLMMNVSYAQDCSTSDTIWVGQQNVGNDPYFTFDGSTVYINAQSWPNLGSGVFTLNGVDYTLNYENWGSNAHWYYGFNTTSNTDYSWSITVSCGDTSTTRSGTFSSDCSNAFNGSDDSCNVPGCMTASDCAYDSSATVQDDSACSGLTAGSCEQCSSATTTSGGTCTDWGIIDGFSCSTWDAYNWYTT
ncbi:MAG: hypothetical protein CMF89_04445, partial [Candidatus Marinimicrobia bacterium]|nr:hypothetical protein [Candidatus Neomarinimicrobiota bacterium]